MENNMIPFARVLKYGNIADTPIEIIKMRCMHISWIALSSNGDLYGRGYGSFGDGQPYATWREDWFIIKSGVVDFWVNDSHQLLYIRTNDGKLSWCGDNRYRTGGTDSTLTTTFNPESAVINNLDIKRIIFNDGYVSLMVLSTGGACYLMGSPRAWNGSTTVTPTWSNVANGILEIMSTGTNYFTIASNGVVNGGGQNIANILNTTASSGTFYTWPVSIGTANVNDMSVTTGQYAIKFRNSGSLNTYMGRGFGNTGIFGNGSQADLKSTSVISSAWPELQQIIRQSDLPAGTQSKTYYYTPTSLYFMGTVPRSGSASTGSFVITPEKLVVPFVPNDIVYIEVKQNTVVVYTNGGKIYYAGLAFSSATVSNDAAQFVEWTGWFDKFKINVTHDSML